MDMVCCLLAGAVEDPARVGKHLATDASRRRRRSPFSGWVRRRGAHPENGGQRRGQRFGLWVWPFTLEPEGAGEGWVAISGFGPLTLCGTGMRIGRRRPKFRGR